MPGDRSEHQLVRRDHAGCTGQHLRYGEHQRRGAKAVAQYTVSRHRRGLLCHPARGFRHSKRDDSDSGELLASGRHSLGVLRRGRRYLRAQCLHCSRHDLRLQHQVRTVGAWLARRLRVFQWIHAPAGIIEWGRRRGECLDRPGDTDDHRNRS